MFFILVEKNDLGNDPFMIIINEMPRLIVSRFGIAHCSSSATNLTQCVGRDLVYILTHSVYLIV